MLGHSCRALDRRDGATSHRHHPNPTEAKRRWRRRGASRSGSGVHDHHAALFKAEVEPKMPSARADFFFPHSGVRVPAAYQVRLCPELPAPISARATSAKILAGAAYSQRGSSNAKSLWCAVSAQSPKIMASIQMDFVPDGFRSSSPTSPASHIALAPAGARSWKFRDVSAG